MLGRPLGSGALGGLERKALWPVVSWREGSPDLPREGEPPGVTFVGRDWDRVRVSRDVTRWCVMAGSEIKVDHCPSRICRPYETTGFAPRVPYFASLPSRSQPSPPIAWASRTHTAPTIKLAAAFFLVLLLPLQWT